MSAPAPPPSPAARLARTARSWTDVTVHPHPGASLTFRLGRATIGVLRAEETLVVPVPSPIRTALLDHGLAGAAPPPHDPDWVSRPAARPSDLASATLLLRLSYLYRRLLRTRDPAILHRIRGELVRREVPASLRNVYEAMLAKRDPAARRS